MNGRGSDPCGARLQGDDRAVGRPEIFLGDASDHLRGHRHQLAFEAIHLAGIVVKKRGGREEIDKPDAVAVAERIIERGAHLGFGARKLFYGDEIGLQIGDDRIDIGDDRVGRMARIVDQISGKKDRPIIVIGVAERPVDPPADARGVAFLFNQLAVQPAVVPLNENRGQNDHGAPFGRPFLRHVPRESEGRLRRKLVDLFAALFGFLAGLGNVRLHNVR